MRLKTFAALKTQRGQLRLCVFARNLLILLSATLLSCQRGNENSGEHLSREMMQKVMLDVNIAEAYCINTKDSMHKLGTKNIDSLSAFYKRIFDHYKITEQQFSTSLEWYKYHPAELDSIYAKLIPIVSNWQSRLPPAPAPAQPIPAPLPPPNVPLHALKSGTVNPTLRPAAVQTVSTNTSKN